MSVPARIVEVMSDEDQATLYSLAANCSLYEEDPQPARMNIGSVAEPMMVTTAVGWRDFYARHLLVRLGADVERVAGVCAWAQQELPKAPASVPGSHVFGRSEWAMAVELCERARGMIQEAGAERDPFARRRLLAGWTAR
jgi:hypothetical protein